MQKVQVSKERQKRIPWEIALVVFVLVFLLLSFVILHSLLVKKGDKNELGRLLQKASEIGLYTTIEEIYADYQPVDDNTYFEWHEHGKKFDSLDSYFQKVDEENADTLREGFKKILDGVGLTDNSDKLIGHINDFLSVYEPLAKSKMFVPIRDLQDMMSVMMPELQCMKEVVKSYSARAIYHALKGNKSKCLEDLLYARNITQQIDSDYTMISRMVVYLLQAVIYKSVSQISIIYIKDAGMLEELKRFTQSFSLSDAKKYISTEMIMGRQICNYYRNPHISQGEFPDEIEILEHPVFGAFGNYLIRANIDKSEMLIVSFCVEITEAWDDYEKIEKLQRTLNHKAKSNIWNAEYIVPAIYMGMFDTFKEKEVMTTARQQCTLIGLSSLAHRAKTGAFPTLHQAAEMAGVSAKDPYLKNQQDLKYKIEGERFIVYSVGKNKKDDDGKTKSAEHPDADDWAKFEVHLKAINSNTLSDR